MRFSVSAAKPTIKLTRPAAADDLGQNVLSGRKFQRERPVALELLRGNIDRAVVGHRGGLDDQRGLSHALQHGLRASRSAVVTLTSSQCAGGCRAEGPLTRITLAPRLCAASARA